MTLVKIKTICVGAAVLVANVFFLSDANAQGALRQACRGDYQQFCADVQPGGGRIAACLKNHADQLSAQCQQALQRAAGNAPRTRDEQDNTSEPDNRTTGI